MFAGSGGHFIGPGHYHLFDPGNGVQKFSCSYEADLDRGGAGALDIRPLLWSDGWPVAGDNFKPGAFEIESVGNGLVLELDFEKVPSGAASPGDPATGRGTSSGQGGAALPQNAARSSTNWPAGNIGVRMADYRGQPEQKWSVAAVPNAGGYPGSPWFKITIAGTDRALTATRGGDLVVMPSFAGVPGQLWRLDQLADGDWRIMPDSVPGVKQPLALWAINEYSAALAVFNPAADNQRWRLKAP